MSVNILVNGSVDPRSLTPKFTTRENLAFPVFKFAIKGGVNSMNKNELVNTLASSLDTPKAQARKMLDTLVEVITKSLSKGEKVQISGLATFEVASRDARPGRNPQTGEKITIPARKVVRVSISKPLKDAVR